MKRRCGFLGLRVWMPAGLLWTLLCLSGLLAAARAVPDPRYYRYDQIMTLFETWEQQYPSIFHVERLGKTGVGQESIWAARISDNAAVNEREPTLLFHAAQHSNEPNGTNAIMFMMERLLTRYGQDPEYTEMVDGLQMWFVPIVNVDGHRMAFSTMPAGLDWRKTKRDNNGDGQYTWPADGVDMNRNWDFHWTEDPAVNPSDEYYKGPWPFSEPEVISLRNFILARRPLLVMDYHSPYHHTMGDVVFWPWLDSGYGLPAPDVNHFRSVAQMLMSRTETEVNGDHYGGLPGFNDLPKEQNWVYANTEICVLLMEISRDNFWSGATVDTIAARTGRGSFSLMERALSGPGLSGQVTDASTGAPLTAEIRVAEAYHPQIGPYLTEREFGSYWRFLNTGTYTVTVHAENHHDQTRTVQIMSGTWTVEDFQLVPEPSGVESSAIARTRLVWSENPLRPGGSIHLSAMGARSASLRLFTPSGRLVRELMRDPVEGASPTGRLSLIWDGCDAGGNPLPAGMYFLRAESPAGAETAKIALVK